MAENPTPERTTAPPAWGKRIRTGLADARIAARRRIDRLPGRNRPPIDPAPAADEVQGVPSDLPDPGIGLRRTVTRARLMILIIVTVAQVLIAVIAWRIKVGRARRRGQAIDL